VTWCSGHMAKLEVQFAGPGGWIERKSLVGDGGTTVHTGAIRAVVETPEGLDDVVEDPLGVGQCCRVVDRTINLCHGATLPATLERP